MSFRARLTLVAAAAVAVAILAAAVVVYFVVQSQLMAPIDDSLPQNAAATSVRRCPEGLCVVVPQPELGGPAGYAQLVPVQGPPILAVGETATLPFGSRARAVAAGTGQSYFSDEWVRGTHLRVYTTRFGDQYALQIARPLTEVDRSLAALRAVLVVIALGGVALAALLGRAIARAALGPIHRLGAAVDHVTETQDMSQRVPDQGQDELSRLGGHFNRMLGALDESLRMQRQLVADASHELRTPLSSLRTNIEVLQRSPELDEGDRRRLLLDLLSQVQQLTHLVQDLIDLARGDQAPETLEDVRLDWIVAAAVERAASHWPAVRFSSELHESLVTGEPRRLDRAVANLLDNAGKWSPPGEVVEVRVLDHEVTVRDHGPGIEPNELGHVFDRFWRAPGARAMPGSGLGLAIVRQVAEAHGGAVTAELPEDGGTLMRLQLPNS